ncbi:MAG TPA: S8 family serine peptidase [Actinomycetes bacterium]|nr:S8 family serine peptidase [Actinomycetes bacterium]
MRAPGSTIDTRYPNYVDGSYRQGSGTSMAAGVVSGAVALMLQANPSLTPDRVKFALTATARGAASHDPLAVGAGTVDAHAAAFGAPSGLANVGLGRSTGQGNLGASRGTVQTPRRRPAQHRAGSGARQRPQRPAAAVEPARLHRGRLASQRLVPVDLERVPLLPGRLARLRLAR